MLTIIKHTFYESLHKRMALVIFVVGIFIFGALTLFFTYHDVPGKGVMVKFPGSPLEQPIQVFARDVMSGLFSTAGGMWFFLSFFAIAPLLTSYLEKGAAELLFTKGISRVQIFLGRLLGALLVYFISMVFLIGLPALFFYLRGGISPRFAMQGALAIILSFCSLAVVMALTALFQNSVAAVIGMAFVQLTISIVLLGRASMYSMITWKLMQKAIDIWYYILPKNAQLFDDAMEFLSYGKIQHWMPIWSTALFIIGCMVAGALVLRRKNF